MKMGRQRDAVKKKNKNKDNNNTSLRIEIPSMWHGRAKKDSAILS